MIAEYKEKPTLLVAHSWYFTLFLAFVNIIVSISNAASNDSAGRATNRSGAFAAIWSMFVLMSYAVGGTWVLRCRRTPTYIGFLVGSGLMISQMFFVLFVVYAGFASTARDVADLITDERAKDKAMSAVSSDGWFAFFSFVNTAAIGFFALVVTKYRYEIIPVDKIAGEGAAKATTTSV